MKKPAFLGKIRKRLENESKQFVENVSPKVQEEAKKIVDGAVKIKYDEIINGIMKIVPITIIAAVCITSLGKGRKPSIADGRNIYIYINELKAQNLTIGGI